MRMQLIMCLTLLCFTPVFALTPKTPADKQMGNSSKTNSTQKYVDVDQDDGEFNAIGSKKKKKSTKSSSAKKHVAAMHSTGDMVMIINPEMRAQDLNEAFAFLRKMSKTRAISMTLLDGRSFTHVLSMDVMKGGTMVIVKTSTTKGVKYHVVNIENIENITHE
ncbi:hypothetical protein COB21_03950 [Candidatus Aerophobetes bacterium]|uniref:Uncharacterized protein n=1 Tax=Aerophobetes bacterium TaxID=2030807 RepID=A0A2A4X2P4_UNCAE|nr:MAG: hypothetical protein COB21_03950 [Candidatus Aerophobetes bacterium]